MLDHICPKYFKYENIFKMNRIEQPLYKLRTAPKLKINLDNKSAKKVWIRRSNLLCHVAYTSLKAVTSDVWYYENGCS